MLKNIYLFLKSRMGKPLHRFAYLGASVLLFIGCAQGSRPSGGKNLWAQLSQTASSPAVTRPSAKPFEFKRELSDSLQTKPLSTAKIKSSDGAAFDTKVLSPESPTSLAPARTGQGPTISTLSGSASTLNPSSAGNLGLVNQPSSVSFSDTNLANPNLQLPPAKNLALTHGTSFSGTPGSSPAGGGFVARSPSPSNSPALPSDQGVSRPVLSAPVASAQADVRPISAHSIPALTNSPSLTNSNIPKSAPREDFQTVSQAIVAGSENSSSGPLPLVLPGQNSGTLPNSTLPPPTQPLAPPEAPPPAAVASGSQGNQPSESIGTSRTALALTAGLNPEPVEQFGEASNHPPGWQPTSTGQGLGHLFILVNLAAPDGTITTATYETDDLRWPEQALKCFPDRPGNPDAPIFPGENRPVLRFDSGPSSQGPWKQDGYGFKVSACGQRQISNTLTTGDDYSCGGYMRIQATWSESRPGPDGKAQKKHYRAEKIIGCENFENGQVPQKPLIQMELKEATPQFERIMVIPGATSLLETE